MTTLAGAFKEGDKARRLTASTASYNIACSQERPDVDVDDVAVDVATAAYAMGTPLKGVEAMSGVRV